jgi:hypothetical protein
MPDGDSTGDASARRHYIGVFVCEAATLLGLWICSRLFS